MIRNANRNDLETENTTYIPTNSDLYNVSDVAIEYTQFPKCHMDHLDLGAQICNVGRNDLNNVRLQATVYNSANKQVFQTTSSPYSLDSNSCIGGNAKGYRPPVPDTVFGQNGFLRKDTGTYRIEYKAITDTADCDTTNNFGPAEEFKITRNTFAIDDHARTGEVTRTVVAPQDGGGFTQVNAYNTFEFSSWADPNEDTVEQVSVWIADTTQVGAGPITVGVSNVDGAIYRQSKDYYVKASDIGGWVTLDLELDSNGNNVGGLPVPVGDGKQKTAFVKYSGGAERVGYGTSGQAQDFHSYVEGDFGGGGSQLYSTSNAFMLRVHMNEQSTVERTSCDSITVPSGDDTYYSSGVYKDTLSGFKGCDSIFYLDATVKSSTSDSLDMSACTSYTLPSGDTTVSDSGIYRDTIKNEAGCDSLLTIDLSMGSVDTVVDRIDRYTLKARKSGADSYQWMNCYDGFSKVDHCTTQTCEPAEGGGNYAVIISNDTCTDTSNCHFVYNSLPENDLQGVLEFHPNPTKGKVTIEVPGAKGPVDVRVFDLHGRAVSRKEVQNPERFELLIEGKPGIYLVRLENDEGEEASFKVVKE